jgi:hypothetical protein
MSRIEDSREVVRLTTAANPVEAHIWEEALQAEGIECKVVGDYLDSGIGDLPAIGPEVWVHRDDLARAQEILRQGQEAAEKHAEEGDTIADDDLIGDQG